MIVGRVVFQYVDGAFEEQLDNAIRARIRCRSVNDRVDLLNEEWISELKQAMNAMLIQTMTSIAMEDDVLRELKTFQSWMSFCLS